MEKEEAGGPTDPGQHQPYPGEGPADEEEPQGAVGGVQTRPSGAPSPPMSHVSHKGPYAFPNVPDQLVSFGGYYTLHSRIALLNDA